MTALEREKLEYSSSGLIKKLKNNHPDLGISTEEQLSATLNKDSEITATASSVFDDLRLKIGRDMRLDHVIFLFGNGASMYAGSQSTMKFSLAEYLKDGNIAKEFQAIHVELNRICSSFEGIEEQLNALITLESYYSIIQDSNTADIVSNLIDKIKGRLIESYVNKMDYTGLTWHEVLLRKLRSFGALSKTQIYTTNYDLAFEYAMDELFIEYRDGFSGFVNRLFDPRTLVESGKPSLVKIHGSVNWVSEDGRIKAIQPKFEQGHIVIKQDELKPVLIYPTSNKLHETYSTPYSELMRHMLDEMKSGSNAVIVMGYKYGDDHVNEILYKALENPRNVFYFFIFDDPDKDADHDKRDAPDKSDDTDKRDASKKSSFITEVRELAKNMPNINILIGPVLASFEVFVNYILPAAAEKTDEEQIIELLKKAVSQQNEKDRQGS